MKKSLIVNPFGSFPKSIHSHTNAAAEIIKDLLVRKSNNTESIDICYSADTKNLNFDQYDQIYFYLGPNYKPGSGINIWGGLENCDFSFEKKLFDYTGSIKMILTPYPKEYLEGWRSRLKTKEFEKLPEDRKNFLLSINTDKMEDLTNPNLVLTHKDLTTNEEDSSKNIENLIVGDSHATSLYRPGWYPYYNFGKTLHGALKQGLNELVKDVNHPETFNRVEFYFGNIDIRFHACRLYDGYWQYNVKNLAEEYVKQVDAVPIPNKAIYELLPIEHVSRKMAKATMYKGQPFYGSWEERNNARLYFKELLFELIRGTKIEVIEWTDYLLNSDRELDFRCMEKPKSIHLSRASYPYWNGTSNLTNFLI